MSIKRKLVRASRGALLSLSRVAGPRVADRVATTVMRRLGLGGRLDRDRLRANICLYFPNGDDAWVETMTRALEANTLRAKVLDKFFLWSLPADDLARIVVNENFHYVKDALDAGRGVIVASLHYGRFWAIPAWFSKHGLKATAYQKAEGRLVAQTDLLAAGSFNAQDPQSALRAVRALKAGACLFLLLDAGRVGRPVVVEFLGKPTLMSSAAVRLARAADAVLVPGLVINDPADAERIVGHFYGAIDPRDIPPSEPYEVTLRRVVEYFEDQVRSDPSLWYGLQSAHRRLATESVGY
jgi:lauroyl/myristoyl acyltransferase